MADLNELRSKSFADQLRTGFTIEFDGAARLTLLLSEVNEPPSPPNVESFSLIFTGPASPRLPQRTYRMEHEKLGSFSLFLTAVAADGSSIAYEAVFHRVRKKTTP